MMPREAEDWVKRLGLLAHPEGGFYKEVYRSAHTADAKVLGIDGTGPRAMATSIYFLVTSEAPSHLHRLRGDELWHHYSGGTLEIVGIMPDGSLRTWLLGKDAENGCAPQHCVLGGIWFGARMARADDFALCGCTMAPGFDFQDFELAGRQVLTDEYPQHAALIAALTKAE